MRLIFHGILRKQFGESFEMNSGSVRDAIEGYSTQIEWPKNLPVHVVANGVKLNDMDQLESYYDDVHIMPALMGGGGKFGQIIIGAVMIVVGVIMVVTSFGTNAMGWSLIISGTVMVLQGVVALFMKAPKVGKNEDPEASKYLNVNKNTTAIGTPITLAWGRIDLAGHWLSLQSDSSNLSIGSYPINPT